MLNEYYKVLLCGNAKNKEKAYRALERFGMDRITTNMILRDIKADKSWTDEIMKERDIF